MTFTPCGGAPARRVRTAARDRRGRCARGRVGIHRRPRRDCGDGLRRAAVARAPRRRDRHERHFGLAGEAPSGLEGSRVRRALRVRVDRPRVPGRRRARPARPAPGAAVVRAFARGARLGDRVVVREPEHERCARRDCRAPPRKGRGRSPPAPSRGARRSWSSPRSSSSGLSSARGRHAPEEGSRAVTVAALAGAGSRRGLGVRTAPRLRALRQPRSRDPPRPRLRSPGSASCFRPFHRRAGRHEDRDPAASRGGEPRPRPCRRLRDRGGARGPRSGRERALLGRAARRRRDLTSRSRCAARPRSIARSTPSR